MKDCGIHAQCENCGHVFSSAFYAVRNGRRLVFVTDDFTAQRNPRAGGAWFHYKVEHPVITVTVEGRPRKKPTYIDRVPCGRICFFGYGALVADGVESDRQMAAEAQAFRILDRAIDHFAKRNNTKILA